MFYKETKNNIITGVLNTNSRPQDDETYKYEEIAEEEYLSILAEMGSSREQSPTIEERLAQLEQVAADLASLQLGV